MFLSKYRPLTLSSKVVWGASATALLFSISQVSYASVVFEWKVQVLDQITSKPIEGTVMDFEFTDVPTGKESLGTCITDAEGKCTVTSEGSGSLLLFSSNKAQVRARFKANKQGYSKRFKVDIQDLSDSIKSVSLWLTPGLISEFVVKDINSYPVEGAQVVSEADQIHCTTQKAGVCRVDVEDPLYSVRVIKPGYSPTEVGEVEGNKQYIVRLGTPDQLAELERMRVEDAAHLERLESEKKKREEAEERARIAKEKAEERVRIAKKRAEHYKEISALPNFYICIAYGNVVRKEPIKYLSPIENEDGDRVLEEAKRRKLGLNEKLVGAGTIRLGISECQMYASWGIPKRTNTSVGRWGRHEQHVYDGAYVYVENGRVTSWQD